VFDTHERGIVVGHWHRRRIDPTNSFSGACQVSLPAMERPVIISLVTPISVKNKAMISLPNTTRNDYSFIGLN
jgi:hypothetical protein